MDKWKVVSGLNSPVTDLSEQMLLEESIAEVVVGQLVVVVKLQGPFVVQHCTGQVSHELVTHTPLCVEERVGQVAIAAFRSCRAASVFSICRLMIVRASSARRCVLLVELLPSCLWCPQLEVGEQCSPVQISC